MKCSKGKLTSQGLQKKMEGGGFLVVRAASLRVLRALETMKITLVEKVRGCELHIRKLIGQQKGANRKGQKSESPEVDGDV